MMIVISDVIVLYNKIGNDTPPDKLYKPYSKWCHKIKMATVVGGLY